MTTTYEHGEDNAQNIEDFISRYDDLTLFNAEKAIAFLLLEKMAFLNNRRYIVNDWDPKEKWVVTDKRTTVVFLNCSDIFAWGLRGRRRDPEQRRVGH